MSDRLAAPLRLQVVQRGVERAASSRRSRGACLDPVQKLLQLAFSTGEPLAGRTQRGVGGREILGPGGRERQRFAPTDLAVPVDELYRVAAALCEPRPARRQGVGQNVAARTQADALDLHARKPSARSPP